MEAVSAAAQERRRIEEGGPPDGKARGDHAEQAQHPDDAEGRERIGRPDSVQEAAEQATDGRRSNQTEQGAANEQPRALSRNPSDDASPTGPEVARRSRLGCGWMLAPPPPRPPVSSRCTPTRRGPCPPPPPYRAGVSERACHRKAL